MIEEKAYEELTENNFSEKISLLKKEIESDKDNALNYYYLAKEYMLVVPIRALPALSYIEDLLKEAIRLNEDLWAPRIFLGELLFKQGKWIEAKKYFEKALAKKPESVSVRDYLAQCNELENSSLDKYSETQLLYMFENNLRKFITFVLDKEFSEMWWRKGVPTKTRSICASRREEGLEEEMDKELLLFANFFGSFNSPFFKLR